jgi:hypothetical protein
MRRAIELMSNASAETPREMDENLNKITHSCAKNHDCWNAAKMPFR